MASFSRIAVYAAASLPSVIGVAFVGRYGLATSDTLSDGIANAFIFGMVAAGAFTCPAFATIAARNKRRVWACLLGALAAIAIAANWSNTLGAIAGRGAVREAHDRKASDDEKDSRAQLSHLDAQRKAMQFVPTTAAAVEAAHQAVSTAEHNRISECGANNERRGRLCRDKENEEQTKRDALAIAMSNKDATDQANRLDTEAAAIRAALAKARGVATTNPLGQALGRILAMDATTAGTLQQGLVAAIVELLIAASLVLPEVLRRHPSAQPERSVAISAETEHPTIEHDPQPTTRAIGGVQLTRPMLPSADARTVACYMLACLKRQDGAETAGSTIFARYQRWCGEQIPPVEPLPMTAFAEQFALRCRRAGIKTRRTENKVYCVNIALSA